jgi:hypothetical protein
VTKLTWSASFLLHKCRSNPILVYETIHSLSLHLFRIYKIQSNHTHSERESIMDWMLWPQKFICWKSNHLYASIWKWELWWNHESEAPVMRSVSTRGKDQNSFFLHGYKEEHMTADMENVPATGKRKGLRTKARISLKPWSWIPASRTRDVFLLFQLPSSGYSAIATKMTKCDSENLQKRIWLKNRWL